MFNNSASRHDLTSRPGLATVWYSVSRMKQNTKRLVNDGGQNVPTSSLSAWMPDDDKHVLRFEEMRNITFPKILEKTSKEDINWVPRR
jgi:hypothetical protein